MKKNELIPQVRISPSSINTYFKCPRSYFYNYIAKLPIKPNIHMIKGSIVHKILEDFFRGYKGNLQKHIKNIYLKTMEKNEKVIKTLELTEKETDEMAKDCLTMITEYFETFKRKVSGLVDSEKAENEKHAYYLLKPKFREIFVESKELHCCGFIDRVNKGYDGLITLGDYKTSKKYGVGLPVDYKRQLSIYALLYKLQEKTGVDFVAVIFLRYGEEYILEVTPSLLRFARDTIQDVYSKTRSTTYEDYPLNESNLCRWCQFQNLCSGEEDFKKQMRIKKLKEVLSKKKKL